MDSQIGTAATGYVKLSDPVAEQTFDNLIGDRKVLVKRLTTLIQNTYNPYVIGLNSEWGSGKTFFLNAWRSYLSTENPEAVCIYFNAWKNDCSGDPLANLMATVEEQITDPEEKANKAYAESARAVAAVASKLFKWGGKVLTATGNPVGGAAISFCGEAGEYLTNKIKEVNSAANDFCMKLEAFSKIVRDTTNFPLFIMVDELDRCRPDYAIELLERIKHLFSVSNVVFLLALDGEQILQQVEHTFGLKQLGQYGKLDQTFPQNNTTADTRLNYLGKFIDIFYRLPDPDKQQFLRIKLDQLLEVKKYDNIYGELGFVQCGLASVLTADKNIFKNKSLRELIQNLELFSIFLRIEENLQFEEIFVAFHMIFLTRNRMNLECNLEEKFEKKFNIKEFEDITAKLNKNEIRHEQALKLLGDRFDITDPASAQYVWICLSMTNQDLNMIIDSTPTFYKRLTMQLVSNVGFISDRKDYSASATLCSLKNMSKIEKIVYNKIYSLSDFT
ncbi:KAP family P-loop NTPase fold protein [Desulfovibrio sp. QI0434]